MALTVPLVVTGAFTDALSLCSILLVGLLLALLATKQAGSRGTVLAGTAFALVTGLVYMVAGIGGIPDIVQHISTTYWLYWVGAFLTTGYAGASVLRTATRQRPRDGSRRGASDRAGTRYALLGGGIALLVAPFQLPCTGQAYLAVLDLINTSGAGIGTWLPWLALYNFVFVLPLLLLTAAVATIRHVWTVPDRWLNTVQIAVLYILGGVMIWFVTTELAAAGPLTQELLLLLFLSQAGIYGYLGWKHL